MTEVLYRRLTKQTLGKLHEEVTRLQTLEHCLTVSRVFGQRRAVYQNVVKEYNDKLTEKGCEELIYCGLKRRWGISETELNDEGLVVNGAHKKSCNLKLCIFDVI